MSHPSAKSPPTTILEALKINPPVVILNILLINLKRLLMIVILFLPITSIVGLFVCPFSRACVESATNQTVCAFGFWCTLWKYSTVWMLAWYGSSMNLAAYKYGLMDREQAVRAREISVCMEEVAESDSEDEYCYCCGDKLTHEQKVACENRFKSRNRAARRAEAKKEKRVRAAKK